MELVFLYFQTRWELPGLDGVLRPSHFSLGVRGALYSERQGIQSRLKGQLEMSVSCILPRELALVPDDVLRGVSETVRPNPLCYILHMVHCK